MRTAGFCKHLSADAGQSQCICLILLFVLVLASCSRRELEVEEPEPYYTLTITDSSTRSLLASDGKGFFGSWESGDRLGSSVSGDSPAYSNITPGTPASFRIYRRGGIQAGETIYAYYPYNSATKQIDKVQMSIPTAQTQDDKGFSFDAMPMAAAPYEVGPNPDTNGNFTYLGEIFLMNLAALLEFRIFSSNAAYCGEQVSSVSLSADAPIAGSFSMDISRIDAEDEGTLALPPLSQSGITTVLNASGNNPGSADASPLRLYMSVAPGSFGGTVKVTTDKAEYIYHIPAGSTFRRGVVKSFGLDLGKCRERKAGGEEQAAKTLLDCYEVPALETVGQMSSGFYDDYNDNYWRWEVKDARCALVSHTFQNGAERRRNYTVYYDGTRHCPLWCAFAMHADTWGDTGVIRSNKWVPDPAIDETWQQSGLDNASSVGYSRGHFVASNYRKTTWEQNAQTFYYSNQAPQWQNSFNSGVWSTLEGKVKAAAPSNSDTLYVVTGVLFEGTQKTLPSSGTQVTIPSHFYKCLMMCSFDASGTPTSARGIAYIYTNEAHSGVAYNAPGFVTTIDAIEERSGLDFFPRIPASLQDAAEASAMALW